MICLWIRCDLVVYEIYSVPDEGYLEGLDEGEDDGSVEGDLDGLAVGPDVGGCV